MNILRKNTKIIAILIAFANLDTAQVQSDDVTASFGLTSDQVFRFAPNFTLEYKLSDKIGLSTYGIFWGAGTGAAWGNWTEFGGGVNLYLSEGITLNPNLGLILFGRA